MERLDLARRLASAATALPGIVDVTSGPSGEIAEYGAGGRVAGVALTGKAEPLDATVAVRARYRDGINLQRLADDLRESLRQAAEGAVERVDVVVADLIFDEEADR